MRENRILSTSQGVGQLGNKLKNKTNINRDQNSLRGLFLIDNGCKFRAFQRAPRRRIRCCGVIPEGLVGGGIIPKPAFLILVDVLIVPRLILPWWLFRKKNVFSFNLIRRLPALDKDEKSSKLCI